MLAHDPLGPIVIANRDVLGSGRVRRADSFREKKLSPPKNPDG